MATTSKKKKVVTTVAAVVTSAALLLGGTLAWQSINQTALNEASDVINPGGRLHDDFYIDENGDYNADIYVENFDKEDIYARVQLQEYMEIIMNYGTAGEKEYCVLGEMSEDIESFDPDTDRFDGRNIRREKIDDVTTLERYQRFYATRTDYAITEDYTVDAGIDQNPGADPAFYWTWTMGSPDSEDVYFMPTFNKNKDSLVADRNGMYVDRIGGISNREPAQYEYTPWAAGQEDTQDAIYDSDYDDIDQVSYDFENLAKYVTDGNISTVAETHTAKAVGKTNGFITMSEWQDKLKNGDPTENYWVWDDNDENGWIYWSSPIPEGEATGLLLDSIELKDKMDDTWYYAINVIAQFVTADDVGKSDGTGFYDTEKGSAPTDAAEEFLEDIGVNVSGEAGDDPSVTTDFAVKVSDYTTGNSWTINNGSLELTPNSGTAYNLSLVSDSYTADDFTWEIAADSTADSSSLTPNGDGTYYLNFPADGDNGTYVVVTVTNNEDASKAATLKVTLDQDDEFTDPEPDPDETDPIVLSVKAEPDWYIPNASNNSIDLTAELTENGAPIEMGESPVEWNISAVARAMLGEYTQLTDNGNGTATLTIDPSEQNNVLVTASYTHTDGKERTGEILITNGPRLGSMGAYDLDEGKFVGSVDFLPDGGTYNFKVYFFPNYTGTIQPVEDAYTGDAADILASRLSVYACESIDDHVQIPDPEGVTIEQHTDDPSLVTVTIEPGVSESFHILFDVENGMQMPFSFDVPTPELVWTGASQQDPDSPVHLAPGESATYQLINVSASCAEADISYLVWSGNAADSGNFSIAINADDARIATITHDCDDEDSCTCGEDYYFVSASNIPGIADGVVSPNAISISAIDYVIYDHTYDLYHYSANGVPSTLTEGDYTVYLTSGRDIKYTGDGAGFDWSSDYITITDNAVTAIPDEEGAYYVTASFTLDSSIPTGVYYINATNNAEESWSIPIEWSNPADNTLYSLYAWAVDENDRSTDTYTQGGEPAVYIKASVWDDDAYDYVYNLTEASITWTIEGDSSNTANMSFVEVDEDGSYIAKLNPGDAQEAITITAAYTAPDGPELTAPVNLNVIFKASDSFTLDGEKTSLVHPANSYDMVYTDEDGETGYTFEITEGSGVAEISGNVLTIVGDAAEFEKIVIEVKNADGETVDTINLSVSHHITFKSVYDGETTILINGSPTNVYAGADYTAWLGNDVRLALGIPSQPEGDGPITPDLFEDYGVVPEYRDEDENGDIIRYTFNQSGISASITGTYTYGEDFIIEDFSAVDILWAYSVGIEYSLNGGDRIPYDETTLFLEDGDNLTLYATSYYMDGSESDPQPSEFSWFIGENGNNPSINDAAFGPLTNGYAPDGLSYSIVSVNDMATDLRYDIRVSTDLHNDVTVNILKGDPAIDGPTEVEVESRNDYGTNTLRDYIFSINAPEEYAYFDDWYLVVTPEAEAVIGETYTITATPDGHDGSVLTMDVTIVAHDYSYVTIYVDGEESYESSYGGDHGTYFILSAAATDRNGDAVDASELVWTVTNESGEEDITNAVLTDNGDGYYGIDLSGQTDNICVKVEYTGENQGNSSYSLCNFYYDGEAVSPLSHLEMYNTIGSAGPSSANNDGILVPIISTARDSAVYLTAYDENWEDYTGPIVWSCSPAGYLDEGDLSQGVVALTNDSIEMPSSVVELTITATDEQGNTADFAVLLYHADVHTLVDTLDRYSAGESGYYHIFKAIDAAEDEYCVYRHGSPLPYCMLELTYSSEEVDLYELAEHYDSYIIDPGALYSYSDYIGICGHPNGANGNYPQDEAPMFSVANNDTGEIYATAISSGDIVEGVLPGSTLLVTSTRLVDNWDVPDLYNEHSQLDTNRATVFFNIPDHPSMIGQEIDVIQTDTARDETFTITIKVADPGPTFNVSANGEQVAAGVPIESLVNLPILGLTEDVEVTVTSTYPTGEEGFWEVNYDESYFAGASTDEYTYTFTIPVDTLQNMVVSDSIFVHQNTGSTTWNLYLNVTEPEAEPEPIPNASLNIYYYQPGNQDGGNYLQPGVTYDLVVDISPHDDSPEDYLNTGLDLSFTVTGMDGSVSELTDYTLTHASGSSLDGLTFSNDGEEYTSAHPNSLVFEFTPGESVQYGTWINAKAETTAEHVIASIEESRTVTQGNVSLNVKLHDKTTGVEVSDYFVAENTTYDVVATLEHNGETYTVHSTNEEKYPLSTNIAKVYDEINYFVLHDHDFMENQQVPQVTLNEDGTITVGTNDPNYHGDFTIVITVNDLRLLNDDSSVKEHLYAHGQTVYFFPGEGPLTIFASPLTVNEFDPILGKDVHILRVYEDGFETTLSAEYSPQGVFIPANDAVFEIVSERTDSNTRIAGDTLIIGKDETATEITVKGVSDAYKAQGTISIELDYTKAWYTEVAEIVPGSADTVNIDGVDWYVLSNENGVAELLAANAVANMAWDEDDVRYDGLHPKSYTDSDVTRYLNGEFLATLNTVRDHLIPSYYQEYDFASDATETGADEGVTSLSVSDPVVNVHIDHRTMTTESAIPASILSDMQTRLSPADGTYNIWTSTAWKGATIPSSGYGIVRLGIYISSDDISEKGLPTTSPANVHPVIFVDLHDAGMPTPQVLCDTAVDGSVTLACSESAEFRFTSTTATNEDWDWSITPLDANDNPIEGEAIHNITWVETGTNSAILTHSCEKNDCYCTPASYRVCVGDGTTKYCSDIKLYHSGTDIMRKLELVASAELMPGTPAEAVAAAELLTVNEQVRVITNVGGESLAELVLMQVSLSDDGSGLTPIGPLTSGQYSYNAATHELSITDSSIEGSLILVVNGADNANIARLVKIAGWAERANSITPGSAETVTIDGYDWFVLSNNDGVVELLAADSAAYMAWDADNSRADGLHPLSYTGSDVVNWLNGDFLNTLTTAREYLVPSGYTVRNWPSNATMGADAIKLTLDENQPLVTLITRDESSSSNGIPRLTSEANRALVSRNATPGTTYYAWTTYIVYFTGIGETEATLSMALASTSAYTTSLAYGSFYRSATSSAHVHPVIFVDLNKAGGTPQVVCDTAVDGSVTLSCGESAEFRFANLYLTNADVEWFLDAVDEDGNVDNDANYSIACTEGSGDTATLTHNCVEGYCTCDGYAYRVGITYEENGETKTLYGSTAIYHEGGLYKELTLVSNADRDDYANFPCLRLNTPVKLLDENGVGLAVFGYPNSPTGSGVKYYDVDAPGFLLTLDVDFGETSPNTYDESTHTLTIREESLVGNLCFATGRDEEGNPISRYFWLVGEDGTLPYSLSINTTANKYPVGGSLSITYTASAVDANGEEVSLKSGPAVYWKVTNSSGIVTEDTFVSIFPAGYNQLTLNTTGYTDSYTIEAYLGGAAAEPFTLTPEPDGTGEPSFTVGYAGGSVIDSGYAPNSTVTVTPGTEVQLYSTRSSTTWSVTGATEAKAGYNASTGTAGSYYHVTVPALADAGSDITVTQTVDGETYSIVLRLEGAPVFVDEEGNELASVVNVAPGQVIKVYPTNISETLPDNTVEPDDGPFTISNETTYWQFTVNDDASAGSSLTFTWPVTTPTGTKSYILAVTFVVVETA